MKGTGSYAALLTVFALPAIGAEPVDLAMINRIVDEGLNHSELAQTAAYLTDRIGGRMTNSPQMREAERWTQERYRAWGLEDVRREGFEFGRGWSIDSVSVRMTAPRPVALRAIPIAWTPASHGTLTAGIVVAPMARERDFERWRGRLRNRIVLVTRPDEGSEPDAIPFERYSPQRLLQSDVFEQPVHPSLLLVKYGRERAFLAKRDAFLAAEGALAWVQMSRRDGGLLHGQGYGHRVDQTPALPGIEIAAEDYRRLARLAIAGAEPKMAIESNVRFHDEDRNAYNVLVDIPGRDGKAGYVMAGAHLDSWVASDGAQDDAAGCAVVMESARILAKLGARPRRAIRFALWAGEEQGSLGSLDYIQRHLATRPPVTDARLKGIAPGYTWATRWPIQRLAGHAQLSAYFNIDNGPGRVRGLYAEGNLAVIPIFQDWLAPFASLGATEVAAAPTGGTDHVGMQAVGIPAFQFIQDPLDYLSRVHHSSADSYDHLKIEDLRQAAVILASVLWMSAERSEPLPRMPIPVQPAPTNPFDYADDEEVQGED